MEDKVQTGFWIVGVALAMTVVTGVNATDGAVPPAGLMAGTAKVEITPPPDVAMSGYARRPYAKGIHDPLFARVLVLADGRTSLALVACDLVWLYSDRIVREAREQWGLDYVVLCGTHTHSGPSAKADDWLVEAETKIVSAIGEAKRNLFAARIGAGARPYQGAYFGYNRRFVGEDGRVTMKWTNPGRVPNGPTDPTVRVFRVEDDAGKTRALAVHYAAHAVVLGGGNPLISGDFPGAMSAYVERELGGDAVGMFLQGGGGDVHPYEAVLDGNEYAFDVVCRTGESLGKTALSLAKDIQPQPAKDVASIEVKQSLLRIAHRADKTKVEDIGVMAIVINDRIAFAIISGEPFVQHQLDLAAKSPLADTFLLGYAWFGKGIPLATYLPSRKAALEGGYGADGGPNNFLEVGAGERMIDEAARLIRELTGAAPVRPAGDEK